MKNAGCMGWWRNFFNGHPNIIIFFLLAFYLYIKLIQLFIMPMVKRKTRFHSVNRAFYRNRNSHVKLTFFMCINPKAKDTEYYTICIYVCFNMNIFHRDRVHDGWRWVNEYKWTRLDGQYYEFYRNAITMKLLRSSLSLNLTFAKNHYRTSK